MPNRIIKESIRTSKNVNNMTDFQFRCWAYLITYVDDYGRGSADPQIIKGFVFPRRKRVTESDIEKTLAELAGMGCINLYNIDGESYFYFPNWGKHQRIQTKKSKFPTPPTDEKSSPLDSTVNHGDSPDSTVGYGGSPPESESESESESVAGATARTETGEEAKKHKHGEYGWVLLSDAEYERLVNAYGEDKVGYYVGYVDEQAQSTGNRNKWKDWNLVVRKAIRDGWGRYVPMESPAESPVSPGRTIW